MNVLILAPHPDDEVLGCGGTISRYIAEGNDVYVCVVTSGYPPIYEEDYKRAKKNGWPHIQYPDIMKAHKLLEVKETFFLQFPTVMLETVPRYELNGKISELVQKIMPEVVFIPHFGDMQRDHALVSEAVMVAVRPKYEGTVRYVYSYETLSETEWNIPHAANSFIPNTFVDITPFLQKKLDAMSCFTTQLCAFPNPRSLGAVEALAKLRGSTMGSQAAEAFALVREYRLFEENRK